jgi:ABC-2 type transport system permease protein
MSKVSLIIKREYMTRVRKKSFVIMTLLGPLLFAAIVIAPIWLTSMESSDTKIILVIDESGLLSENFADKDVANNIDFQFVSAPVEMAKMQVSEGEQFGLLLIPNIQLDNPGGITLFSESSPSLSLVSSIEKRLQQELRDLKLAQSNISREMLAALDTDVDLQTINLTEAGEQQGSAGVASVVGYVGAFLIYTFIFLYGAQVMRGVMEEKSNRIVEVVISSVRPFQLMMGKIVGVASVGLTQFLLWIALTFGLATVFLQGFSPEQLMQQRAQQMTQGMPEADAAQAEMAMNVQQALASVDVTGFILTFLFYFLGGYLLYGALFAAVGSASDSSTDTQQFMLPISAPLILSIVTLGAVLNEPNGTLAFWMSMIPFTSPVTMMMRVPFGIPGWQLALSMLLLVGGFVFTTWIAGRIYRVGILMHGTKVNYKVLGKWLFSNN